MTQQLNQVVALEKGLKARTEKETTEAYHLLQRAALFSGFSKVYTPKDEDGDRLPAERQVVQQRVEDLLKRAADSLTNLLDMQFTKDVANTATTADVKVGERVILRDAPVPFLLTLEKQLINWRTVVSKLPLTDPSEVWEYDEATDQWRTEPTDTTRSKKVLKNHVKAPATDKHPAQVDTYTVDEVVGTWKTTRLSGAVHLTRQRELVDRANKLIDAVKLAVEEANRLDVEQQHVTEAAFTYLLNG